MYRVPCIPASDKRVSNLEYFKFIIHFHHAEPSHLRLLSHYTPDIFFHSAAREAHAVSETGKYVLCSFLSSA